MGQGDLNLNHHFTGESKGKENNKSIGVVAQRDQNKILRTHLVKALVLGALTHALKKKRAYLKFGVPLVNLTSWCPCAAHTPCAPLMPSDSRSTTNTMTADQLRCCLCMCSAQSSAIRCKESASPALTFNAGFGVRGGSRLTPFLFNIDQHAWLGISPINQYSSSQLIGKPLHTSVLGRFFFHTPM